MSAGFREVTKAEFFEFIAKTPGDPMPHLGEPFVTVWRTASRQVVAKSYPGWKGPYVYTGGGELVQRWEILEGAR